eukprot:TRINITY_DN878_c4_g1_i1.p1 TRINITY_DN878_c4_g1~~TRINITY_DN878_c4_g1_i1.p1  ORF type:complete len:342 (+),score=51.55 TRINITY_DN878_c4_g1_i1:41-1027(+)
MKVLILCLIAVIFSFTVDARLCNQCLWEGAYCGPLTTGECVVGTKCVTLENGAAPICMPTVLADVNECQTSPYDNCPSLYSCNDDKKCQLSSSSGDVNDGCSYDDECGGNLVCTNNVCSNPGNLTCFTTSCPFGKKCDDFTNPTCVDKGGPNSECTSNNDCWQSSCIGNLCRKWFTAVEGAICTSTIDCSIGLICETREGDIESKCYEPLYHYIAPTGGSLWGPECDSSVDTGCLCNDPWGREQFVVERLANYKEPCKEASFNFLDCMKENECYGTRTYEQSCTRQNCWIEYRDYENQCLYEGANPVRCSASDLLLGIILIVAMLFLH